MIVPDLGGGLLGCYRCGNVWRFRKSPVRICPRCKSKYWDSPRKSKPKKVKPSKGLGVDQVVGPHRNAILALAEQFGATRVRVFGSVARGEAGPQSDVDILVSFREPIGLIKRAEFRERAAEILGRRVDLATEQGLHWLIRPTVVTEAVPL
jgi:hypothetical protein